MNKPNTTLRRKKFLSFFKPYKGLLAADLASALFATAAALLIPLCTRYIIDGVLAEPGPDAAAQILWIGAFMAALILTRALCAFFNDSMGHIMGARMERDMRAELFGHMQKLPLRFFDEHKTGELTSRINNDLLKLAELYHHGPEEVVLCTLSFLGAFGILLSINAGFALALCGVIPIMFGYSAMFHRKLKAAFKESYEAIAEVQAQTQDSLENIRATKGFARAGLENEKFSAANERYCESRSRIYKHEAYYFTGLGDGFAPLMTALVIVLGGLWIAAGSLTVADFIAFVMYAGYLTAPIPKVAQTIQQYQEGMAAFHRFMDILEVEPEPQGGAALTAPVRGEIRFEDVSFRYQSETAFVLDRFSLHVRAGEHIAVVGPSGVGKTTLCALIPRFYELSGGRILLDGTDTRTLNLNSLREHIGVVFQDVPLFAGTVLENISYAKPGAPEEEIIAAAKRANAHAFIESLPQGYQTYVGPRGVKLSGGQRQRLGIARVFLKDPPILILDEATSALDNQSERAVYAALGALSKGRTTFVIAHRLSTIRDAERILVLSNRGIEEQGTHAELLQRGGLYAKLYRTPEQENEEEQQIPAY